VAISLYTHGLLHRRRIASAGIGAALLSVLFITAPANAATTDAISAPASPPAAEVTASVEQVATAPVEQAPAEEVGTAATPSAASEVDVPTEPADEVDVPAEPVEAVSEVEEVASTAPSSAVPRTTSSASRVKDVVSSVPSPGEATNSASSAVPVDVPSGADPAAVDPTAIVGRLVEKTGESPVSEPHVDALVDEARRHSTETVAAATGRLTVSRGEPALPPGPLTLAISAEAEGMRPSATAPVGMETTSDHRRAAFPNLRWRSGLLPNPMAIALPLGGSAYLNDAGALDTDKTPGPTSPRWGMGLSPSMKILAAATGPGDRGLGNPAPPDLPPPAPQSPATAEGDAGGPSSVPVVALLALLALAAPAARRRLGEVAAFRPPTPFVCALERPG
jgi:MYXO-CTERM domain-containing protein